MTPKFTFPAVCLSESELLQWVARGRIHLLADRVMRESTSQDLIDLSFFTACTVLKLDDAKGRIWVSLTSESINGSRTHPYSFSKNVLDLPLSDIRAIGSILPQHKRRLDAIDLPISDSTLEAEWNQWLLVQGAYERFCAIELFFNRIGFELTIGLDPNAVQMAMRPNDQHDGVLNSLGQWRSLLYHRDEILQKLRFDGHAGEKSFFAASIQALLSIDKNSHMIPDALFLRGNDGAWSLKDISLTVNNALQNIEGGLGLPHFVKAAYLRSFDDLHYGQKDWSSIFDLVRYIKYSIGHSFGSEILFFLLSSMPVDEIINRKFQSKF